MASRSCKDLLPYRPFAIPVLVDACVGAGLLHGEVAVHLGRSRRSARRVRCGYLSTHCAARSACRRARGMRFLASSLPSGSLLCVTAHALARLLCSLELIGRFARRSQMAMRSGDLRRLACRPAPRGPDGILRSGCFTVISCRACCWYVLVSELSAALCELTPLLLAPCAAPWRVPSGVCAVLAPVRGLRRPFTRRCAHAPV